MDIYVIWAGLLGALSAMSLLIGSLIGVGMRLPRAAVGMLAAFGAGALLSALAIELVAPTPDRIVCSGPRIETSCTDFVFSRTDVA